MNIKILMDIDYSDSESEYVVKDNIRHKIMREFMFQDDNQVIQQSDNNLEHLHEFLQQFKEEIINEIKLYRTYKSELISFGDEDILTIDPVKIRDLVTKYGKLVIPDLVKLIHINKDHPEYQNIYIYKNTMFVYCADVGWREKPMKLILDRLFNNTIDKLYTYLTSSKGFIESSFGDKIDKELDILINYSSSDTKTKKIFNDFCKIIVPILTRSSSKII